MGILGAIGTEVQETEHIEPMVQGHDHDTVVPGQISPVVGNEFLAGAGAETAAVEPHHHGALPAVVDSVGPDIHPEAVFVGETVVPVHGEGLGVGIPAGPLVLRTGGTVCPAGADFRPGLGSHGRLEPLRPGIRDALVNEDSIVDIAGHRSGRCPDGRRLGGCLEASETVGGRPAGRLAASPQDKQGNEKGKDGFQCHVSAGLSDTKVRFFSHNPFASLTFVCFPVPAAPSLVQICSDLFKNA